MNKKIIILYVLGIFFHASFLHASASAGGKNFVDQIKGFGNTIGDMFKGMGGMFGVVPDGYHCSWEVINDSDQEIDIYYKNFISVMGGFFPSSPDVSSSTLHAVQPYQATFAYVPVAPASASSTSGTTPPPPAPPTSGFYSKVKYYFAMFMGSSPAGSSTHGSTQGTTLYQEYQLTLGQKDDNSINYYHVYTGKRFVGGNVVHMPMVEIVGFNNPDAKEDDKKCNLIFGSNLGQIDPNPSEKSAPAGSVYFYNTTSKPVQLTITLSDGVKYLDITLEPFSYNLFSCPPPITINDSTLAFGGASPFKVIKVPLITAQGSDYIFEIYQDVGQATPSVAIQGFNPGNYDICVSSNIRDISPQQATLWIQSVAQKTVSASKDKKAPAVAPTDYDLPGQVWMVYQSASANVMQKVTLGNPTVLKFIRPSLADQIGYVYFIYVHTQADSQATTFVTDFLKGSFGDAMKQQAISTINAKIDVTKVDNASDQKIVGTIANQNKVISSGGVQGNADQALLTIKPSPMALSNQLAQQVLSGKIPSNIARLQDDSINVTGYVLGIDVYTSFGGTTSPISYYKLTPATISLDTLAGVFGQYLKDPKIPTSDVMNAQISTWLQAYIKDAQSVKPLIVAFLVTYGSKDLFDSKGALTKGGQQRVNSFVNGLVSLANPPILYSPVSAQSPAYTPPANMPGAPQSKDSTPAAVAPAPKSS